LRALAQRILKAERPVIVAGDEIVKVGEASERMTVAEVKALLPEVLADVRVWVRKVNDLAE